MHFPVASPTPGPPNPCASGPASHSPVAPPSTAHGVNFAVYSRVATRVEVCLYDPADPGARDRPLRSARDAPASSGTATCPGSRPARSTACACTGPTRPSAGTAATRTSCWSIPTPRRSGARWTGRSPCSATGLDDPRRRRPARPRHRPARQRRRRAQERGGRRRLRLGRRPPARDALAPDRHLRGARARLHQAAPRASRAELRGTYAGLAHPAVIEHLTALGVTAVELLPVHEFADDGFLEDRALRNYWGYSTLAFFAPEQRYASRRARPARRSREFKAMVKALHAAGIEVILDVVYNHTCEGNHLGPDAEPARASTTPTYYWLMPERALLPGLHRHRQQPQRVEPGGGAPDRRLAALLGRARCTSTGSASTWPPRWAASGSGEFSPHAPIFQIIAQDPVLSRVKLIAEPWDVGLGGYQVGNFPAPFSRVERQVPRRRCAATGRATRTWRPRSATGWRARPTCSRASGGTRRRASTSSPRTTASRCTTWSATASKHNEANGEHNRDGADDNQSWNHGVEGETDDPGDRRAARRGRSATCWRRCSCRRACRCCWAATRWGAPSAATTTPTARTTSCPGSTGTWTIGAARCWSSRGG